MKTPKRKDADMMNRDPLTDEPGSHPLGTGVGAASMGVIGAATGALGGPVGAAIGAVVGTVVGGMMGHELAEDVNPTLEDAFWRSNYTRENYVEPGMTFHDYGPAYRVGYMGHARHAARHGGDYHKAEPELEKDWDRERGESRLQWEKARHAARAAWLRMQTANVGVQRIGV
jgi:hypothetical protein